MAHRLHRACCWPPTVFHFTQVGGTEVPVARSWMTSLSKRTERCVYTSQPMEWVRAKKNSPIHHNPDGYIKYHSQIISPRVRYPRDVIFWIPPSYYLDRNSGYVSLCISDTQL